MKTLEISDDAIRKDKAATDVRVTSTSEDFQPDPA
jgi:hypothetical protein